MTKEEAQKLAQKYVHEAFFDSINGKTFDEDYHLLHDLGFTGEALNLKEGDFPFTDKLLYCPSDYTSAISTGKLSPESIQFSSSEVEDIEDGDFLGVKGKIRITIPFTSMIVIRNVFEIYYSILCAADKRDSLDAVSDGWFIANEDSSSPEGYDLWYYIPEININNVHFEDNYVDMDIKFLLYEFTKAPRIS